MHQKKSAMAELFGKQRDSLQISPRFYKFYNSFFSYAISYNASWTSNNDAGLDSKFPLAPPG